MGMSPYATMPVGAVAVTRLRVAGFTFGGGAACWWDWWVRFSLGSSGGPVQKTERELVVLEYAGWGWRGRGLEGARCLG